MAIDEREYAKTRQGWSIKNLTGFRRTAKQIEESEYDDLRKKSARDEKTHLIIGIITTAITAFFVWKFFL